VVGVDVSVGEPSTTDIDNIPIGLLTALIGNVEI